MAMSNSLAVALTVMTVLATVVGAAGCVRPARVLVVQSARGEQPARVRHVRVRFHRNCCAASFKALLLLAFGLAAADQGRLWATLNKLQHQVCEELHTHNGGNIAQFLECNLVRFTLLARNSY